MKQKYTAGRLTGMMIFLSVLLLLGSVFAMPAFAGIYYVDPAGSDEVNDGASPGTAWKTLHFSIAQMAEGSTLYVQPGVYNPASGEPDAPLILSKNFAIIGNGNSREVVIDGSVCANWQNGIQIGLDGTPIQVTLQNLTIKGFGGCGVQVDAGAVVIVDNSEIHDNYKGIEILNSSSGSVIENSRIYFNHNDGIRIDSSSVTVNGCEIFDNGYQFEYGYGSGRGINVYGSEGSCVISGNKIYSTGRQNYGVFIDGSS